MKMNLKQKRPETTRARTHVLKRAGIMKFLALNLLVYVTLCLSLVSADATIIGDSDPRTFIINFRNSHFVSDDDIAMIEKSVGVVSCPNAYGGQAGVATVLSPGNVIVSAAHIFIGENGHGMSLDECLYYPFNRSVGKRKLRFSAETARFGFQHWNVLMVDPRYDWAVVQLDRPISSGFDFASSADMASTSTFLSIMPLRFRGRSDNPTYEQYPYAQICHFALQQEPEVPDGGILMAADCSEERGQSGSPALVRAEGRWKLAGVLLGQNENQIDFRPFDKELNSTKFVGFWNLNVRVDGKPWRSDP